MNIKHLRPASPEEIHGGMTYYNAKGERRTLPLRLLVEEMIRIKSITPAQRKYKSDETMEDYQRRIDQVRSMAKLGMILLPL